MDLRPQALDPDHRPRATGPSTQDPPTPDGRTDEQGDSRSRIENMKWAAELKVGRNVKVAEM